MAENKIEKELPSLHTGLPQDATWGGFLNEFFWICSGVNREILRKCPTDWSKYFGIGGLILFTALMASLSGGYAFFTIFDSVPLAIAFGCFWGALIFNLDRFIVNTMYSDGEPTISGLELLAGTPRLIIAIFLGIVISTPLEMKIFEDRIETQITLDNINRINAAKEKLNEGNQILIDRRSFLENKRNEISARLAKAEESVVIESEGSGRSGVAGHGPIYEDKVRQKEAIEKELENWKQTYEKELENIRNQIAINNDKVGGDIEKTTENKGFCVRYEAFSNAKKESTSVRIVSLFIMLMLIVIEIAPTFFKMMVSAGTYDNLLEAERHKKKVISQKFISDINDQINTEIKISTGKNQAKLEAELKTNKEILDQIASVQSEILQEAIKRWREEEMKKVQSDPAQYFNAKKS